MRTGLGFGLFIVVLALVTPGRAAAQSAGVRVVVHDSASLPASIAGEARALATSIFEGAGVVLAFAPADAEKVCRPGGSEQFCVQVLLRPKNAASAPGNRRTMGMALAADANRAVLSIYLDAVTDVARRYGLSVGQVLGITLAHELGHVLLPPPSHADEGIMQPAWEGDDLRKAAGSEIAFSSAQAALMRERLGKRASP